MSDTIHCLMYDILTAGTIPVLDVPNAVRKQNYYSRGDQPDIPLRSCKTVSDKNVNLWPKHNLLTRQKKNF